MLDKRVDKYYTGEKFNEMLREIFHIMLRITEFARKTGASADELRYLEKKGYLNSSRTRLERRVVRIYQDSDIVKVQLIIKHRQQGFTWDAAFQKALGELGKPTLFDYR